MGAQGGGGVTSPSLSSADLKKFLKKSQLNKKVSLVALSLQEQTQACNVRTYVKPSKLPTELFSPWVNDIQCFHVVPVSGVTG